MKRQNDIFKIRCTNNYTPPFNNNFQNTSEEKIKNLERQLKEKEILLNKLKNELDSEKNDKESFRRQYLLYKKEKKEITIKLESLEKNAQTLINQEEKEKYKDLEKQFSKVKEDLEKKDLMLKEYEKKINNYDNLMKENKTISEKLKELEQNKKDLISQNNQLKDDNNKLKDKNKKYESELEENAKIIDKFKSDNEILKVKISLNENNLNKLYKEINEKKNSYNTISNQYQLSQKVLKEKENAISDLTKKINVLNEQKKKLETETKSKINEFQNKNNQLIKELEEKTNNYKLKEKELEALHLKFDGTISHFTNIDNQLNEGKRKLEKFNELLKNNKLLKEQIESLKKALHSDETKDEYLIEPAEKFYDVIVDINSINSLKNEGWSIKYNENTKENYNKIISEETMKIGVLGLNNVGKSFLLKKIANPDIPDGYSIETKGISIKYVDPKDEDSKEVKGVCILDSAGFETPLLKDDENIVYKYTEGNDPAPINRENELEKAIKFDEIEDDLARDKAQTERFIEHLIISLSDMLILVVGKLTRTEQRLITRIKNMVRKNEKNKIKSIIIVHNLAKYHKKSEVENHIKQYLKKSATFDLVERKYIGDKREYKDWKYFVEKSDDSDDLQVFHYIMAKDGFEAGLHYNNFTLELIKDQFNHFNKRRAINIPDEIINLFSELSTEILGEKMECQRLEKDKNIIKLVEDNKQNIRRKKKLSVQNAYIDQDGNYLKNKGKFEPKYSLYYYKEKKEKNKDDEDDDDEEYEKYLLLRLELPGNIVRLTARSTDRRKEKYKGIVIKGIKKNDTFPEQGKEDFTVISDNRTYEEFSYFIELKRNFDLSKYGAKGETGIYEIQFDKRNKENYFLKNNAQEQNNMPKENLKNQNKPKENSREETKGKINDNKIVEIASGVYVMKFLLSETSYIPNK